MQSYSDVAAWASQKYLGDYNAILTQMQTDGMIPGYESNTFELYKGVGRDYGYSIHLGLILDSYVAEHGDCTISL